MEKEYTIQYLHNGELLKPEETLSVDKQNFHDMIILTDRIADRLVDFEFSRELTNVDVKVFAGDDFIFNTGEEYRSYLIANKISHALRSDFWLETYVDGEQYRP